MRFLEGVGVSGVGTYGIATEGFEARVELHGHQHAHSFCSRGQPWAWVQAFMLSAADISGIEMSRRQALLLLSQTQTGPCHRHRQALATDADRLVALATDTQDQMQDLHIKIRHRIYI